jgi:hypothetical protein
MIIIQTNRIFVVPEILEVSNENKPKEEQTNYTKKAVKYFIPEFYI